MSTFPSLPLFVDAYISDAGHLTDAEHGRYLLLLMAMWTAPNCRIPNDDAWLARKFRRSVAEIKDQMRPLIEEFCQSNGNWLWQKRLKLEWEWCREKSKKNSGSAKSMWKKRKGVSERNATDSTSGNAPKPKPTPKPIKKDSPSLRSGGRRAKAPAKMRLPPDWQPSESDQAYGLNLGLSQTEIDSAAEEMRLWAGSNGAAKADWNLTFKGWMRRNLDRRGRGPPRPPQGPRPTTLREQHLTQWSETIDELSAHNRSRAGHDPGRASDAVHTDRRGDSGDRSEDFHRSSDRVVDLLPPIHRRAVG